MAAIPSCLRVRRPTMGLNVFRLSLSRPLSFLASPLRPDIRWKIVSSTWRYAQYAEIPRDPKDPPFLLPTRFYLASRSLQRQRLRARRCDNLWIIAPARN